MTSELFRYIAYKFPDSYSYAFLSPYLHQWTISDYDLRYSGFLKHTFDQVYDDLDDRLVYGMYNDERPPNPTYIGNIWYGHMKGWESC